MICDTPFYVQPSNPALAKIPVPCGKCPPCKLNRVNAWVFRLVQEEKYSTGAIFATMTYDVHSVPITTNGYMTLSPEDFRLYMKRLRKKVKQVYGRGISVKYFVAGEYGTVGGRPHYHAIIFNVPDKRMIVDCWSINGVSIGGVHLGEVTQDSIAYCMKYIDKSTWRKYHGRDDRYPEFQRNSKELGIAYLSDHEMVQFHRSSPDHLFCSLHKGHRIALPRYYKRKIFTEDEIRNQLPHIQRVVAQKQEKDRVAYELSSDLSWDYIQDQRKFMRWRNFNLNQRQRDV